MANHPLFVLLHDSLPSRKKASIQYALNHPDSAVGALIAERVPGYANWFTDWRQQRNRVKDGTGFSTFYLDGDIGIQFTTITECNSLVVDLGSTRIGLRDIARALEETQRLMSLVRRLARPPDPAD